MMTAIPRVSGRDFTRLHTSMPDSSGIIQSRMIRSGAASSISSIASSPSAAQRTS
jgi:hypothetical protein